MLAMYIGQTFVQNFTSKSQSVCRLWLGLALELGNLNSASGQLQESAVPEVLLCVEPVTCQMLLTLLGDFVSNPFIYSCNRY